MYFTLPEQREPTWRKARRSAVDGACVEIRNLGGAIEVRDSKSPTRAVLQFSLANWTIFIAQVKASKFDLIGSPSKFIAVLCMVVHVDNATDRWVSSARSVW
jgi:uncharacterized protein DUF397